MSIWDKFKEKTSEDFIDDVVTEDKMKEDVSEVSAEDVEVVIDKEEAINKKLSGSASLKKYVELGAGLEPEFKLRSMELQSRWLHRESETRVGNELRAPTVGAGAELDLELSSELQG